MQIREVSLWLCRQSTPTYIEQHSAPIQLTYTFVSRLWSVCVCVCGNALEKCIPYLTKETSKQPHHSIPHCPINIHSVSQNYYYYYSNDNVFSHIRIDTEKTDIKSENTHLACIVEWRCVDCD